MVIAVHRSQWNKVLKSFEHVQNFPPIWPMNSDKFESAIVVDRIVIHLLQWNSVEFCGKLWKAMEKLWNLGSGQCRPMLPIVGHLYFNNNIIKH